MNFLGEASALTCAVLWSFSSFVFTEAAIRIGSLQLNLYRSFLATVFLVITIFMFGLDYQISFEQFIYLGTSGIIGLIIGDTFLFAAFKKIGPRISMLVMSMSPAMSALLAYIVIGEVLSFLGIFGIVVTLAGICIVVMQKPDSNSRFKISKIGVFYSFLAALGQAVGLIFAKLAFDDGEIHSIVATFYRLSVSTVAMLPVMMILKQLRNPITFFMNDKKSLKLVAIGSIIGPYLGITLSILAIVHTKIGIASTLMATVPIIMLPLSRIFHSEKLRISSIIGAFIAVVGCAMLFLV